MPVLCKNEPDSKNPLVQLIARKADVKPEGRAYYLLRLAEAYLKSDGSETAEAQLTFSFNGTSTFWLERHLNENLRRWADQIAAEKILVLQATDSRMKVRSKSKLKGDNYEDPAASAIHQAALLLDETPNRFAKLNLYFIASRLLLKMGKVDESSKYRALVDNEILSCEGSSPTTDKLIIAAASVLNTMAFGIIPVEIPDLARLTTQAFSYTEDQFDECEKLKLRAAAIVDRLDVENHVRRKVHRDLVIWYTQLGETAKAEEQKQILYKLVGVDDDRILYPHRGACGSLVWWYTGSVSGGGLCGMG
jgi:hypothetical protein